jgi:hypothetical protein
MGMWPQGLVRSRHFGSRNVTGEQIVRLRGYEKKNIRIACSDHEVMKAKVLHVDDEYRDVACDLVSTSTPEKYKRGSGICISIKWDDITDIREISH